MRALFLSSDTLNWGISERTVDRITSGVASDVKSSDDLRDIILEEKNIKNK
jgi:hypothetical protein